MSGEDSSEKEHAPTQKKLDDARMRGEVVRSAELAIAAGYGGLLVMTMGIGAAALTAFGESAAVMLDRPDTLAHAMLGGGVKVAGAAMLAVIVPVLPFFAGPAIAVITAISAQRAWVFAPDKIRPKLSRIDPVTNAGQKFGRSGLFEFAKSTAKLVLISTLLGVFLSTRLPRILMAQGVDPGLTVADLARMIVEFLFLLLLISGAFGALDYLWQMQEHLRKNRMSRQELMDELKQSEGDPHMRGQRRQRAEAIAMNRMLADVPKSDVVIVNPTHYAVALRWDRASGRAPVCVAKGVDEVAVHIREAAAVAGVPIHSDPPTARALHATIKVGHEVQPEHYAPVAAAIRFAERMRERVRARRGG